MPILISMLSSSFLGQKWRNSVPDSPLLLWSFISGRQFKSIWVRFESPLSGTGWRMEFTVPWINYNQPHTFTTLAVWISIVSSIFSMQFPNWNSGRPVLMAFKDACSTEAAAVILTVVQSTWQQWYYWWSYDSSHKVVYSHYNNANQVN